MLTAAQKKLKAFGNPLTGSTVGTLEARLLFRLLPGVEEDVSPSSKSPALTLLEGDVALRLLEPIQAVSLKGKSDKQQS